MLKITSLSRIAGVDHRHSARQSGTRAWLIRAMGLTAPFFLIVAPAESAAQEPRVAGFVLRAQGDWYARSEPGLPLTLGQTLRVGESVFAGGGNGPGDNLTVALMDGGRLVLRCAQPATCDRPHVVRTRPQGRISAVVEAVAGLFASEPQRFVPVLARCDRRREPQRCAVPREAVLASEPSGGVSWAAALVDMPDGSFGFEVSRIDSAGMLHPWGYVSVDGSADVARLHPGTTLPPGLYAVRVDGDPDREAWVLVPDPAEGTEVAAAFEEAAAAIRTWSGYAADADARTFLRVYLFHLHTRRPSPVLQGTP